MTQPNGLRTCHVAFGSAGALLVTLLIVVLVLPLLTSLYLARRADSLPAA